MAKHLNSKIGSMEYDNLISGMTPAVKVASGIIAKITGSAATYPRGSVLAKSTADGKLYLLGSDTPEDLTPDCILCDDEEIGTDSDTNVAVYVMGCINENALTVKEEYDITQADRDTLRERGIYLSNILD